MGNFLWFLDYSRKTSRAPFMILQPGEFDVKKYRKAIPSAVKIQSLLNYICLRVDPPRPEGGPVHICPPIVPSWCAEDIQFDHSPALTNRPYDTDARDFIPPQNDPQFITPLLKKDHLYKTVGRKPDAEKTVTTRGSDVGERSRIQDIRASEAVHLARIAAKKGNQLEADTILASVRFKKKHLRQKRKIPQRKNPWGK